MIHVDHLFHSYPGTDSFQVEDASFAVSEGEIFGFLGPIGAGKSTTQKILTGLLPLQRGSVTLAGADIRHAGRAVFNQIGVAFEQPNLYRRLTGLENLRFFAGLYDIKTENPIALLRRLGIEEVANRWVSTYSKEMQQRLALARSLINRPSIWFLDEPTAGLGPDSAREIEQLVLDKRGIGTTVFLTTHDTHMAERLCDRVALIDAGHIVAMDSPGELKLRYGERMLVVERREHGQLYTERLNRDAAADRQRLAQWLTLGQVETIHSQEASLEAVFVALTGKGLA